MAEVKWIKLSTDLFNNRKIKQIRKLPEGDAIIGIWLQILCLAGNVNNGGLVYFSKDVPYTDEMLSAEFDRPISIIRLAMNSFINYGMAEIVDDIICISNWEKYQSADRLEAMNEKNRLRQQKFRENQKQLISNVTVTLPVTLPSISNSISNSNNKPNKDIPPTLEAVKEYCKERNNGIDAEQFIDHYTSNGWYVGKNKMKDWKAAVRTWERNNKQVSNKDREIRRKFAE